MRRRWPLGLLAAVLALIGVALFVTLIGRRELAGSVPGRAPVVSFAALENVRLASTARGVFATTDDRTWAYVDRFGRGHSIVGSSEGTLVVGSIREGQFVVTKSNDLREFEAVAAGRAIPRQDALTVYRGEVLGARVASGRVRVSNLGSSGNLRVDRVGATDVDSMAVTADGMLLIGSVAGGLWETPLDDGSWRRLLATPINAVIGDPADDSRILIGTPGGILVSTDSGRTWGFTDMRVATSGISEAGGLYYALGGDRLVYTSGDGVRWKRG